ncbi:MAG TPA: hypothetical protein VEG24_06560, partial [Gaiellaceae bacterium]|nr:hypothetical protein [Gaiellaceae bacterium]
DAERLVVEQLRRDLVDEDRHLAALDDHVAVERAFGDREVELGLAVAAGLVTACGLALVAWVIFHPARREQRAD